MTCVFTDIIMPGGLNGRELAERIWAEKPELKVIFSSGYGAERWARISSSIPSIELSPETLPAADAGPHRPPLPGHWHHLMRANVQRTIAAAGVSA